MSRSETEKQKNKTEAIDQNSTLVLAGGGLYASTARPILEFGLALSGKDKPNVLLIPTAKDNFKAFETFSRKAQRMFGEDIGTPVEMLHQYSDMPSLDELQAKFDVADVLYLSGGNSRYAVQQWKKHGIDTMLTDAMRKGKIITGISAGALTWFNDGFSDSMSYEVEPGEPWDFGEVAGLGHIDTTISPHFDSTDTPDGQIRSDHFKKFLQHRSEQSGHPEFGLGMDNDAGILAVDGLVKIIASRPFATLHVVRADPNGEVTMSDLVAPRVEVSNENTSIENNVNDGISWEDFYTQLSEPAKNPRVTASAS